MRKIKTHILLIITILNISCNSSKNGKRISLDSKKTSELINQILIDKKDSYLSSSCISENSNYFSISNFSNYGKRANKYLKIEDSTHYKLQKDLWINFKVTKEIIFNKKILTEEEFKSFQSKREFWEWEEFNCTGGFCTISKPFFNEKYDLAYVQISKKLFEYDYCSQIILYEYKNGKWIEKEIISQIIS